MDFNPKPYGCHNRPPFSSTVNIEGEPLRLGGRVYPTVKEVYPFKMERKCQYTLTNLGQIDPGCAGCRHRKEPVEDFKERDHVVFRSDAENPEQVSVPLKKVDAQRFLKNTRADNPDEFFYLAHILKD